MPELVATSTEATTPSQPSHCRAIKTDGTRCNGIALKGLHLCWSHFHHRHPALADKDHISVPLLEDHASIQLVMTQIVHGLFSHTLDPARARTAIWAAQVAAYTLPRPARLKGNEPQGESVHRIGADHDGLISADPDPGPLSSELCALSSLPATGSLRSASCVLRSAPSNLNYLCQVSATAEEVWALQDRDDLGVNQPPPEQRYIDPWHAAPPPQPFPGWNVPPPPPPPPPPAHESGLPCDCPKCVADEAFHQKFLDRYYGRPRKKSRKSADDPDANPLCPSNKPDCLGAQAEFCCRSCRKLRPPAPPEPIDEPNYDSDHGSHATNPDPAPRDLQPVTCNLTPGVIPDSQYPTSPTE